MQEYLREIPFSNGINYTSKLPLYQQLYEILREKIALGEWKPGELIPPESEMIDTYHLSRATVRQVMEKLTYEGLIVRKRGLGTFITKPKVEQTLLHLKSFTENMHQFGIVPGTKLLEKQLVPSPADIAKELNVNTGEELAMIVRLRLGDGDPLSMEESYLVHNACPGILDNDITSFPLTEILLSQYHIRWMFARQLIRAIPSTKILAKHLTIPLDSPVLFIQRVSYSMENKPLEFLRIYHRGDRFALYNEIKA